MKTPTPSKQAKALQTLEAQAESLQASIQEAAATATKALQAKLEKVLKLREKQHKMYWQKKLLKLTAPPKTLLQNTKYFRLW